MKDENLFEINEGSKFKFEMNEDENLCMKG